MKKISILLFLYFFFVVSFLIPGRTMADVEPLIGATLFGGAERGAAGKEFENSGNTKRVLGDVVGFGGFELFGILPLSRQFGLQGSFGFRGESDGYHISPSLGGIFDYGSGKFGLFVDYDFRKEPLGDIRPDSDPRANIAFRRIPSNRYQNFIFLRGLWTHYFQNFDVVLSYTQPVHSIQESSATDWQGTFGTPACFPKIAYTINELKGTLRFYPTSKLEVDAGMLVNSFTGIHRNVTGTGVGGVFGLHYAITNNIILNIAQAQGDSRSRFKATSGIQFFWSPASPDKKQKREEEKTTRSDAMLLASSSGTHGNCL